MRIASGGEDNGEVMLMQIWHLFLVSELGLLQDMAPYVPLLIPDLQQALIDPLPEVRATAAKAIGSLLKGMGEHHSQDLMPWLLQTLKSEVRCTVLSFGAYQSE